MPRFKSPRFKLVIRSIVIVSLIVLIGIDLASTLNAPTTFQAIPMSSVRPNALPEGYATSVALVRSDDSALPSPVPQDSELTNEQIIEMVFRVLDMQGGLDDLLFAGANITIKPNVVEPADLENGVNTDPRVVEGLIRWMEANGPGNLNYTVAEAAGGWLSSRMRNTKYNTGNATVTDGFRRAGYTDMKNRLSADGIEISIVDANFGSPEAPLEGIRFEPVPEWIDFPEYEAYWIHEAILDPDVLINVPVMKTHTPQITVCLKNYIGIAAGAKYGTYKGIGGPERGDPPGLHQGWPERNSIEREIVDLASIAPADYSLVDALICKERGKTASHPSVRRNMVLAGTDMVAIDSICARLMGLNPDDVSHLCSAAREGLGTMDFDSITLLGEHTIEDSLYYFERPEEGSQGNRGHFGSTNRLWLVNRFDGADINAQYLSVADSDIVAKPGEEGWSEPVYFSDDIIDFEAHYGSSSSSVFYAFCWVKVPEEQDAELWIAHDEPCSVWIGGEQIFQSNLTTRNFGLPGEAEKTIHLKAGVQPMLVKLLDRSGTARFVLNICRILPSQLPAGSATYTDLSRSSNYARYEGTRVLGLKFAPNAEGTDVPNWRIY